MGTSGLSAASVARLCCGRTLPWPCSELPDSWLRNCHAPALGRLPWLLQPLPRAGAAGASGQQSCWLSKASQLVLRLHAVPQRCTAAGPMRCHHQHRYDGGRGANVCYYSLQKIPWREQSSCSAVLLPTKPLAWPARSSCEASSVISEATWHRLQTDRGPGSSACPT